MEIHSRCINKARCHGVDHGIEIRKDGIYLFDDHDSNAGTATFTGYCSLSCLLLDVWHALGNDGENIGDRIRELRLAAQSIK